MNISRLPAASHNLLRWASAWRLVAFPALGALLLLQGCATGQKGPSFTPAPRSDDVATVYVYRLDTAPYLRKPDVKVNDVVVSELPTNSYTVLKLKPGNYTVKTDWNGAFSLGLDGLILNASTTLSAVAGKSYYVNLAGKLGVIVTTVTYGAKVTSEELTEPPGAIYQCSFVPPKNVSIEPR
ncbi:DUF2846 domain-containing protein [Polaromonas sp. YR568]|uniref:DUF2846 domain-containing protein n=1 Tax=Polaromonas sp. YR568 TaxID=1855301 RepID=UPI00398C0094